MRVGWPHTLALLLLFVAAEAVHGQVVVHGRVLEDEPTVAIPAAEVVLTDADGRLLQSAVTDSLGHFRFDPVDIPAVRLEVSRLGFRPTTTHVLHFDAYRHFEVEVRLARDAVLLAPLEVVARSADLSPVLEGFEHRRNAAASGWFFTRDDIDRIRPALVTDLVARVPGVRLESSGRGTRRTVSMTRSTAMGGVGGCPVQVFVDGLNINRGGVAVIDEAVSPQSVEGIEVYRGLSSVPAPFLNPDAHCGVVVVWTRRGGGGGPS
jgi:hypothetical protein